MIEVENDYQPVLNEHFFYSHIYKNQMELPHNYYIRPTNNNKAVVQEDNEINTLIQPEKDQIPCSRTSQMYQNIQKQLPKENFGQLHFS